ncbi:hypothetical protein BDU57DRAFT_524521 [Ampelomyces quisqualis]|uniref:Uncharacterized protein n=1 Tax=Ampelomyces quisqualis TaxID=50730 RepID=A0A6A5Q9K3_AMPQU|nr:hypothetical protein BDU57DRAFT_524521 [Ampelomyces quisqualis]
MSPFSDKAPKVFFLFDEPMTAKGREENMLGVAFENPKKGTRARYTPQGPRLPRNSHGAPETSAAKPGILQGVISYFSKSTDATEATSPRQSSPEQATGEPLTYNTSCTWPKDLGVDDIYPRDGPTIAVGIDEIQENIKDAQIAARIVKAVSFGLKVSEQKLASVHIPVLRRHTMEDPVGKIEKLLDKPEYRHRLIKLLEKQHSPGKKRLYIATAIIACAGVSLHSLKTAKQEVKASAKDPTETVPMSLEAGLHHLKEQAQRGEYKSEIVLCMSYHSIRYEYEPAEPAGYSGHWRAKKNQHDPEAIRYPWDDGFAIFRIDNDETEGEVPAFFSCDMDPSSPQRTDTNNSLCDAPRVPARRPAIFEDSMMEDSDAGAQQSEDENLAMHDAKGTRG